MILLQIGTDKTRLFFKHRWTQIIVLVSGCWLLVSLSYAQPISSNELINNARRYDGKRVIYRGEVVGDIMPRRQSAWLNLYDGEKAIGIWVAKENLPEIKSIGGYRRRGDLLEAQGIFHASCPEHGGDLDLHAQRIKILRAGYDVLEEINPEKKIWARNLSLSAFFLFACVLLRWSLGGRRGKQRADRTKANNLQK